MSTLAPGRAPCTFTSCSPALLDPKGHHFGWARQSGSWSPARSVSPVWHTTKAGRRPGSRSVCKYDAEIFELPLQEIHPDDSISWGFSYRCGN